MGDGVTAFRWNVAPSEIARRVAGDDVLLFAARAWHGLYVGFVPCDTGRLGREVRFGVKGQMGVVEHLVDYAACQYGGHGSSDGVGGGRWDQMAKAAGRGVALAAAVGGYIK